MAFGEMSEPMMLMKPISMASVRIVPDPQKGSRMVDCLF